MHVDCYRLRGPDEAVDLDFPGLQQQARTLLIEWPENAGCHAPQARATQDARMKYLILLCALLSAPLHATTIVSPSQNDS